MEKTTMPISLEEACTDSNERAIRDKGALSLLETGIHSAIVLAGMPIVDSIVRRLLEPTHLSLMDTQAIALWSVYMFPFSYLLTLARIRRGVSLCNDMALRAARIKTTLVWTLCFCVFFWTYHPLTWLLGVPVVPESLGKIHASGGHPLAYLSALAIAAPVAEELFIRGFIFERLISTRIGKTGTVLLTTAVWAAAHSQYGLVGKASVFLTGLMFAGARVQSNSIIPSIAMHSLNNIMGFIIIAHFATVR